VTQGDTDRILVSGVEMEEIGRLAAAEGLVLHELSEQGVSLEDTFLALTERQEQL
jgi:ABC-2 type transport system ATP-binding protein